MAAFYKESQSGENGNAYKLMYFGSSREGAAESESGARLLKVAAMEKQEKQEKWLRIKVIVVLILDVMV